MKTNSRYDWRVDGPLLSKELAEDSDIAGSVNVAVEHKPAVITAIPYSFPVGFSDNATRTTRLTGVPRVDVFNNLSKSLSFIFKEIPELPETPITQEFVEPLSVLLLSPDIQLLQDKKVGIAFGNLFANAVVDITHKPSFPSTETFKMSLGGTGAFTLQACFQPLVFSFDCSNVTAVEEFIAAGDYRIDDSPIYSNNPCWIGSGRTVCLSDEIKIRSSVLDVENRTTYSPVDILLEVIRNGNIDFDSAECCRQGYNSTIQKRLESIVIKPDSGKFPFLRQSSQFLTFKHLTGLISSRTDEATIKLGKLLPNVSVSGLMKFCFVISSHIKSFFDTNITRYIIEPYSILNAVIQRRLEFDSSLHDKPLD